MTRPTIEGTVGRVVMPEVWRDVPGYEGIYAVSDQGRVKSLERYTRPVEGRDGLTYQRRAPGRPLRPSVTQGGHLQVELRGGARRFVPKIHQLVLLAFVGPRPDGMEVRHLDGDPTNNRLDNLRYGTRSENMHDRVRHGVHPMASKTHCPEGHPYSAENTYTYKGNGRSCRTCMKKQRRAAYLRKKEAEQ